MKAIEFNQSTKVSNGINGNHNLHYWSDGVQCVSCWKPTFFERIIILFGGNIWLGVKSPKQPPVFISGKKTLFG